MLIFTVYEFDMQYMQIQACLIVFQYCQYFDYTSKSPIPFKTHRKLKMVNLNFLKALSSQAKSFKDIELTISFYCRFKEFDSKTFNF